MRKRVGWGGQDAAVCSIRYAMLCNLYPSHFPTCALGIHNGGFFSGKWFVCSAPSIWNLFKWESNGPDCSKNTPPVLTQTCIALMVSVSTLRWAAGNISSFIPSSPSPSPRGIISPWYCVLGHCNGLGRPVLTLRDLLMLCFYTVFGFMVKCRIMGLYRSARRPSTDVNIMGLLHNMTIWIVYFLKAWESIPPPKPTEPQFLNSLIASIKQDMSMQALNSEW